MRSSTRHVRNVADDHGQEHDALVQHLVVLEVVQQRVRHAVGRRRQEHRGALDARRRRDLDALDEEVERQRVVDSRSISSARPRFHVVSSVNTTAPITSGNQPPSGILSEFDARNARSISSERHRDQRARATSASSTAAASRRRSGSSRSASPASPRCRRRRPGCRTCGTPTTSRMTAIEQRPVDERHVDLPDLALGRVLDREARAVAHLDRRARQRERAGDHRLRRDDGRAGREHDQRDAAPTAARAGRTGS